MAEGGNNTIGRANVELGADTSKLSAGLKDAQKQTEQVVAKTEQQAKKAEDKAKSGSDGFGFGAAKAGALALVAAIQQMALGLKSAMRSGEDFAQSMRNIESAFRSDIYASLDAVTRRREEILKTAADQKKALDDEIRQRNLIEDAIAYAAGDPEAQVRIQKIETEQRLALERLADYQLELDNKLAKEISAKNAAAAAENLDGEAREREKFEIERAKIEQQINETQSADLKKALQEQEQLAFVAMNKRIADIRAAQNKADESMQQERKKDMDELADYWIGINQDIVKQNTENMRAQQQQFSQLRNEINGLFNTNQLEIGINRLGALMEIMVQKIGDSR